MNVSHKASYFLYIDRQDRVFLDDKHLLKSSVTF